MGHETRIEIWCVVTIIQAVKGKAEINGWEDMRRQFQE